MASAGARIRGTNRKRAQQTAIGRAKQKPHGLIFARDFRILYAVANSDGNDLKNEPTRSDRKNVPARVCGCEEKKKGGYLKNN